MRQNAAQTRPSRDERRRHLIDAADAVVRRKGAAASMDAIAEEAGITKPILYRHFGDKGGLSQALAERYVGMLMRELRKAFDQSSSPAAGLASAIDTYVRFVERNANAYRFLMNRAIAERPEAQHAVRQFIGQLAFELALGMREQLQGAGIHPGGSETWAHGIVGMVQQATDWWLEERPFPRSKLVEYLVQILWRGFAGLDRPPPMTNRTRERRIK